MITWQMLKKSIDNKQFGKGVCTSDDEKPVENIANGSELIEIDTGKRCVFDLGREEWIEYGTGEDRGGGGGAKITTETLSGTNLRTIFDDNDWDENKFRKLADDIDLGRASALIRMSSRGSSDTYFDAMIMPTFAGKTRLLNTAVFNPPTPENTPEMVLIISWFLEEAFNEQGELIGYDIAGVVGIYLKESGQWIKSDLDTMIDTLTGQTSYSIVITRIEED